MKLGSPGPVYQYNYRLHSVRYPNSRPAGRQTDLENRTALTYSRAPPAGPAPGVQGSPEYRLIRTSAAISGHSGAVPQTKPGARAEDQGPLEDPEGLPGQGARPRAPPPSRLCRCGWRGSRTG